MASWYWVVIIAASGPYPPAGTAYVFPLKVSGAWRSAVP